MDMGFCYVFSNTSKKGKSCNRKDDSASKHEYLWWLEGKEQVPYASNKKVKYI